MKTVILAVGLMLFFALPVQAQTSVSSFDQLPTRLKVGNTVFVTDTTGREQKGKIIDLSTSSLALAVNGVRQDFPAARVSAIRQRRRDSLLNGALIGLATGAGVGVFGALSCEGDSRGGCEVIMVASFSGVGVAAGVGIDALIPGKVQTVYRGSAVSTSSRLRVSPMVLREQKGVAVRLSF